MENLDKRLSTSPDTSWKNLPLEEKIGQMIMIRMSGKFYNSSNYAIQDIQYLIDNYKVGGLGMPIRNMPNEYGDLYINFKIEYPHTIEYSDDNIQILSRILKQKNRVVDEEENTLYDLREACDQANSYDSDEEDENQPGKRMECNQQ